MAKKVVFLRKATRKAFVAAALKQDGIDFSGFSTREIAATIVAGNHKCPKGFAIGEGYKALVG